MSKKALKKYLEELDEQQLREQILHLYKEFKEVKVYYDFVFNPQEDKLINEAKTKIAEEYFPTKRRRPRARPSVAQKYLRHFIKIGVSPMLVADLMWYNLEIAQTFNKEKQLNRDAFYNSMARSFDEAVKFTLVHGLLEQYKTRMIKVYSEAGEQEWPSMPRLDRTLDLVDL
ncbi:DUF6155 family protein [Robertkochia aurantiaca]|uniref:DUF6155 family protein n=1 Tax=Robertkochia aurantiaca TaxID=2873700 RepID=UPI001CCBFA4B|nr:DUF6155 family protein [Robertkochia sp. 3YJGBD-33]